MTCAPRPHVDLEDAVTIAFEQAQRTLFTNVGTFADGIECLFGNRVARGLRDDVTRLTDLLNQANMDFDAYRVGVAHELDELQSRMSERLAELVGRLERATTCAVCGSPLTTAIVHRARIADAERRWHPGCCGGRCGNSDAHPPNYTVDAAVPARGVDVTLEIQTGAR